MAAKNTSFDDFDHKNSFSGITTTEFDVASTIVKATWAGVSSMWAVCDSAVKTAKRDVCYGLLIAWYLTDHHPDKVVGVDTDGGRPVASKRAKDIHIQFKTLGLPAALEILSSNSFGLLAAQMLYGAPETMGVYGGED